MGELDPPPVQDGPPADPHRKGGAEIASEEAGIGPDDVDVAEVRDCFTIADVRAVEALGVFESGDDLQRSDP